MKKPLYVYLHLLKTGGTTITLHIKKNFFDLYERCEFLSRLGIYINSWLLYHKGHLYNFLGEETYEPIYSKDYLKNVAKSMWKLSTKIFGAANFSYLTLASVVGDTDVEKVKRAVKRISIIADNEYKNIIWYDEQNWRWVHKEDGRKLIRDIIEGDIGVPNPFLNLCNNGKHSQ